MKRGIVVCVLTLVSAILVYAGKDDFLLKDFLKVPEARLSGWMTCAFFMGITFPMLVAPVDLIVTRRKKERLEAMLPKLLGVMKEHFNSGLKSTLNPPAGTEFNIRIFFPVKGIEKLILRIFKRAKFFKIKAVPGLANDSLTEELCFRVFPEPPQGLVGLTYKNRTITYDTQPKIPARKYHMDDYQTSHTSNVEFVAAGPILNPNGAVVAIISIDCSSSVTVNQQHKGQLEDLMQEYCKHLNKSLPLLK